MIYIVYGLSGPLKRVLIDPLVKPENNLEGITINRRGIFGKTPQSYDKEVELIFCDREEELSQKCGSNYIYSYGDYTVAINEEELKKHSESHEHHLIICHEPRIIKEIKRNYPNTQIIKISFTVSNVLDLACEKYEDDFKKRANKIAKIINKIENEEKIKHDIAICENIYVQRYEDIGQNLHKSLAKKLNSQWRCLLNTQRVVEEKQDVFLAFEQDYNRVINSAAFRRLQDKAQVFPLEKHDYPRTRLTHSIECSAIAEELGIRALEIIKAYPDFLESCYKIPTILKTAALLHDMGNPPFGHFGEDIIQDWFDKQFKIIQQQEESKDLSWQKQLRSISTNKKYKNDFIHFEGNAQLFRLITSLDKVGDNHRINLTYATLAVILKYPTSSDSINQNILFQKKPGYFTSEASIFKQIQDKVNLNSKRHPLTFLLEAADDISYLTSDLQDAHHKKLISWQSLEDKFRETTDVRMYIDKIKSIEDEKIRFEKFHSFLRKKLIKDVIAVFAKNYEIIMKGEFEKELIQESDSKEIGKIIREEFLQKYVYLDDTICRSQIMSNTILTNLLDVFILAVLDYEPDEDRKVKSKMSALNQRIFCLLSDNYRDVCEKITEDKTKTEEEKVYHKILLATDYICGMTDSYAQQMYNMIVALPLNN